MKQSFFTFLVVLIIIAIGIFFNIQYINEFPRYTHAWAQTDRYALALGFVENNLNFFKPQTFILNHQFPDTWNSPNETSITAVNFPVHDFIPAIFMKILGTNAPWIFRLYILIYSFIGLFSLFSLSKLITKDNFKSLFVVIFAATSPVFLCYQAGFLPSIPSLANTLIALLFYIKYTQQEERKHFIYSLAFFTLATLSRTTFLIPYLAVIGYEFIRFVRGNTTLKNKILAITFSFSIIIGYMLYNNYLRDNYGSNFLYYLLPAKNLEDLFRLLKITYDNWYNVYLSKTQYILVSGLSLTFIFSYFLKRKSLQKSSIAILSIGLISLLGCIAFFIAMTKQFPNHDYYFLDTFYLPVILIVLFLTSETSNKLINKKILAGVIITSTIPLIINAKDSLDKRRKPYNWDTINKTTNNFMESEKLLDSLNISKNAKMLVIDAYAPNIPLTLMNRKGYSIMRPNKEKIENCLKWDFDYIVIQNNLFVKEVYNKYPEFINVLEKIADNDKISICKLKEKSENIPLETFLLKGKKPKFEQFVDFDSKPQKFWENLLTTEKKSFSGKKSAYFKPEWEYGLIYKTTKLELIETKNRTLLFESMFFHKANDNVEIAISIQEKGKTVFYKGFDLKDYFKHNNKWEKINLWFDLPKVNDEDYEFVLFIKNVGETDLFYDNFGFKIY